MVPERSKPIRSDTASVRPSMGSPSAFRKAILAAVAWLAIGSTAVRADPEVQALAIATGVVVAVAIAQPKQDETDLFAFGAGRLDAIKNDQPASAFGIEYRFGQFLWWKLRPFVGAGFTAQHSFYGYGGIRVAAHLGERIVITPSFAVGGYSRGAGKDLGSPAVVGRLGIDLQYRFENDLRLGVGYHHMSNGKVLGQQSNRGTEVVGLMLSIPVP